MQTSLSSSATRIRYTADGVTDVFSCPIELIDESYLQVYFGETLQTNGWTYDSSTQQVTFDEMPSEGTVVVFLRNFPIDYSKSITEKGIISPEALDNHSVEMVARIQTLEEKISRAPVYPVDTEKSGEDVYDDFKRMENVATSAANSVLETLEEIASVREETITSMSGAADAAKLTVSKYTNQTIFPMIEEKGQESIDIARTWATGEQAEVEAIEEGQLSSRGFADLSLAFAIAPEDVPVDESGMIAMEVFRGPKGDKGEDGGGLELGDIGFASLGIDESQNKRRYLNGQVISQAQFESFTTLIKDRIALYPSIGTTEENWQAEVTNSKLGQCGKFVIDDTLGTIRLPKVVNVQGLVDLSLMGSIKAESLPNITGKSSIIKMAGTESNTSGAITETTVSTSIAIATGSVDDWRKLSFDASLSSSTYQDNAPVQQEAIQYPYFIQVATGVEESVDVTREIELNNPFSLLDYKWSEYELSNASWLLSNGQFNSGATYISVYNLLLEIYNGTVTKDGVSVKMSTEAYTDTDFVINTADTTFRLPTVVKLPNSKNVVGNGYGMGVTDGSNDLNFSGNDIVHTYYANYRNDIVGADNGGSVNADGKIVGLSQDATKSGVIVKNDSSIYLYFYVGETIQDANIIAASQVLTKVANCIDKTDTKDKEAVVSWGMPDYDSIVNINVVSGTLLTWTAPCDCFVHVSAQSSSNTTASIEITLTNIWISRNDNTNTTAKIVSATAFISKGYTINIRAIGTINYCYYAPLKGVN